MSKYLSLVCGLVAAVSLAACGGSSSGDATSGDVFPTSVGVDVSEVSSEDLQNVNFSLSKAGIPDGGSMSQPITTATNMADLVTKLTDHIFSGISTALDGELTEETTQISGTAFGGTLKIDFADYAYDVDGDGNNDPCSGSAAISATEFACFRVWFNDGRLMIGYVQVAPTSDSSGKGFAVANPVLVANSDSVEAIGMGDNVMTYIVWDNTTAASNVFDGYMTGTMQTGVDLIVGRLIANLESATGKTTLRTAAFFVTPKTIPVPRPGGGVTNYDVDQVLFNSQFLLDGQYLLFEDHFYLEGESVADQQNDIPFCGVIATGEPASDMPQETELCDEEEISLTGLEYPELTADDAARTAFPSTEVFPETPTF